MKGFDTKALILFPKLENYINRTFEYKYSFSKALNNLITYFEQVDITPHVFYTDDVAREINHEKFGWVMPVGTADAYFMHKYVDNCPNAMDLEMIHYTDCENEVMAKDPIDMNATVEERFEGLIKHVVKGTSMIIKKYKIVVHFNISKKSQYRVDINPGDGKIRMLVSASNFSPKLYVGGEEENPIDVLDRRYANRCLDVWEV